MSDFNDDLGDTGVDTGFPLPLSKTQKSPNDAQSRFGKKDEPSGKVIAIRPEIIEKYQATMATMKDTCVTKRDFQEKKTDTLGECVFIAAEIYKDQPIPDFAYQLAALTNAHNTALAQYERMKDPKAELEAIESMVKKMFEDLLKVWMFEVEKSKRDLETRFPSEAQTIQEHFGRMGKALSPESNKLYAGLTRELKKILGIK